MKNIVSIVVAVTALLCSPAFAQSAAPVDPATKAAVRNLLVTMDYHKVTKAIMAQMVQTLPEVMRKGAKTAIDNNASLSSAQRAKAMSEVEKLLPVALAKVEQVMSDPALIDEMIEAMVPVWSSIYTVEELKQLSAFYASPVGKKTLAAMPQMATEGMRAGERIIAPRVNAAVTEVFKTLK